MKKNCKIIVACLVFLVLPYRVTAKVVNDNKHLVQSHISELNEQLKSTTMLSPERRKLEAYLRRYFDNKLHGQKRALKPLVNADAKRIANSIEKSYEDITKTAGHHDKAAEHFALQAAGSIALYNKPAKHRKTNSKVAASRSTEKTKTTASKSAASKGSEKGEPKARATKKGTRTAEETKARSAKKAAKLTKKKNRKGPKTKAPVAHKKKRTKPMSAKKRAKKERMKKAEERAR